MASSQNVNDDTRLKNITEHPRTVASSTSSKEHEEEATLSSLTATIRVKKISEDLSNDGNSDENADDGKNTSVLESTQETSIINQSCPASGSSEDKIDDALRSEILGALNDNDAASDDIQWALLLSVQEQQERDRSKKMRSPVRQLEDYRDDLEMDLALQASRRMVDQEVGVDPCFSGASQTGGHQWESTVLDRICTDDETSLSYNDMQSETDSSACAGICQLKNTTELPTEHLLTPEYVDVPTIDRESITISHTEKISLADNEEQDPYEEGTVIKSTFLLVDEQTSEASNDYIIVTSRNDEVSDGSWQDDFIE